VFAQVIALVIALVQPIFESTPAERVLVITLAFVLPQPAATVKVSTQLPR